MLDGKPMTQAELLAWFDEMEKNGPVPAGQSDSEIEKSWQAYKKAHNIQ
ncbi:MAG: hypothetical protein PUE97_02680 [Subdoligranulum variabile]|jgi:hypothetical protein|nr:hypothetical protein [Subdoligranulum variabile]DAG51473.1 MAG TPA: peptide binding protein [Caudoviricetes sp.]DAZ28124.1 MAG TPA: RNA polymerase-associated protein [Caudoviricetes sp.]